MLKSVRLGVVVSILVPAVVAGAVVQAKTKEPETATLSGKIIDLTCAAKGKATMDSWHNAENNDHMTPNGKQPSCAEMCLRGGQPAALFADGKIRAVFACNPRATLADYVAQDVDVQGFWAGGNTGGVSTFVPKKIRKAGSGKWAEVDCATMHN